MAARPVALLPTLAYGHYPNFVEYPGTVSLSAETQKNVVTEICRSIARYGPRRFYVLNTGVSTLPPLQMAAAELAREGILMRFSDPLKAGKAAEDELRQQKWGTHADEIETSMILYMQPSAVRMDRAVADGEHVRSGPLTRDPRRTDRHYSPSGVFGNPTLATWQKGEKITEATIAAILKEIDDLAMAALPKQR